MITPNGWRELDESENSSTVVFFKGGGRCVTEVAEAHCGDEFIIWKEVLK